MKNNSDPKIITVNASRRYDVIVGDGLMQKCGEYVKQVVKPCLTAVICDDIVDRLYSDIVIRSLNENGFTTVKYVFANGEKSKNFNTYFDILTFLAENKLTRSDLVVALGGGVTGDMAGFASATYLRGIKCVQIATTLLAQIDSSVGGKTAIDLPQGKNLVGAFHQPSLVLCPTDALKTLPKEIMEDGMGEFAKYMILDKSIFDLKQSAEFDLKEGIYLSVDYKRRVVEADEFETGQRKLLNLGHTPAHGIEKLSNYTISHGKAVAMGLKIILDNSRRLGYLSESDHICLSKTLIDLTEVIECPFDIQDILEVALSDKKRKGDKITLVMVHGVGDVRLHDFSINELKDIIR